ncbi:MAG: M56 family metallopeptidase [Lachnospiraceae bacterium]|nr:M56 family metallopeptidase [Lachnospiraceae bacterium]
MIVGRLLFFAWAGGALWKMFHMHRKKSGLRVLLCKHRRAGEEIQTIADRVREDLHIQRNISVYLTEEGAGPWIAGVWSVRIFLPEKRYGEKELEIILEHELRHYKQGDLILKELCGQITWIHWFNPFAARLYQEVNKWGELHCDLWLCNEEIHSWNKKQYFLTILEHTPERKEDFPFGMGLGKTAEELKRRMEKMKYYNPKKGMEQSGSCTDGPMLCAGLFRNLSGSRGGTGGGLRSCV